MASAYSPRQLLDGPITYSAAQENQGNVLQKLGYPDQDNAFRAHLYDCRELIVQLVAIHMSVHSSVSCLVAPKEEWLCGSFNICIPITLETSSNTRRRLIMRFPLPYKVGESHYPGNCDEKLRCEVATHLWLATHCPDVPTVRLWSYGYSNGQSMIAAENAPISSRWQYHLGKAWHQLLGQQTPAAFVKDPKTHTIGHGFLLMDYVEDSVGRMLSESWTQLRHDAKRRRNLFASLGKINMAMGRVPLPRIGSLSIDDDGFISLANRPLTLEIQQLENEGIPRVVPRTRTYETTESYALDLLDCHRARLKNHPNAVEDDADCMSLMSALTIMNAILRQQFQRKLQPGPFFLTLTDLHPSNIFVDDEWHITRIIDLEWACSRPLDMQHPPYWLGGASVDTMNIDIFSEMHREYVLGMSDASDISCMPSNNASLNCETSASKWAEAMQAGWENGNFWYCLALDSVSGMHSLFYDYIQPRYDASHVDDAAYYTIVSKYFIPKAQDFTIDKLEDKSRYDEELKVAFLTNLA